MHFQSISQVAILAIATVVSGIHVPDLPDGLWTGVQYPNGTTITTSLSDPSLPPIIVEHEVVPRHLQERQRGTSWDCWGTPLDHAAVDACNQALQNDFNPGSNFCSPQNLNAWTGRSSNGVLVYFCDDEEFECYHVTPQVIQQGMGLMDSHCAAYESSWALFPDTADLRYIMGKCLVGTQICV